MTKYLILGVRHSLDISSNHNDILVIPQENTFCMLVDRLEPIQTLWVNPSSSETTLAGVFTRPVLTASDTWLAKNIIPFWSPLAPILLLYLHKCYFVEIQEITSNYSSRIRNALTLGFRMYGGSAWDGLLGPII